MRMSWTVDDIRVMSARGPWATKSGGALNVVFAMPLATLQELYLGYEKHELAQVPEDIRGLRIYTVRDLPAGRIGGTEWHKIRQEMVFGLEGSIHWTCEDLHGGKKEFVIDQNTGVWMPPYILHTYEATKDGSGLLVVANTLFNPENSATHDTYSTESFRELQKQ